jgi:hypothetical protein
MRWAATALKLAMIGMPGFNPISFAEACVIKITSEL